MEVTYGIQLQIEASCSARAKLSKRSQNAPALSLRNATASLRNKAFLFHSYHQKASSCTIIVDMNSLLSTMSRIIALFALFVLFSAAPVAAAGVRSTVQHPRLTSLWGIRGGTSKNQRQLSAKKTESSQSRFRQRNKVEESLIASSDLSALLSHPIRF